MLDPDVKVTRTTEVARWTDAGKNEPDIRVEFKVGDHGPFSERFPKATFDRFAMEQILNAFAAKVRTT